MSKYTQILQKSNEFTFSQPVLEGNKGQITSLTFQAKLRLDFEGEVQIFLNQY